LLYQAGQQLPQVVVQTGRMLLTVNHNLLLEHQGQALYLANPFILQVLAELQTAAWERVLLHIVVQALITEANSGIMDTELVATHVPRHRVLSTDKMLSDSAAAAAAVQPTPLILVAVQVLTV
jgi:hypothetical protein